jgi:hypothetical protein
VQSSRLGLRMGRQIRTPVDWLSVVFGGNENNL